MALNLNESLAIYVEAWSKSEPEPRVAFNAIADFRAGNPVLFTEHTRQLSAILSNVENRWIPQMFASSILNRYDEIDRSLMEPLLWAAIEIQDPSANRDFLTPCLKAFGSETVVNWLANAFEHANLVHRIGISSLVYWLRYEPVDFLELRRRKKEGEVVDIEQYAIDASELKNAITKAAKRSTNLVELYFYRLAIGDDADLFPKIPTHAKSLCQRIAGNATHEELLYVRLGWKRLT